MTHNDALSRHCDIITDAPSRVVLSNRVLRNNEAGGRSLSFRAPHTHTDLTHLPALELSNLYPTLNNNISDRHESDKGPFEGKYNAQICMFYARKDKLREPNPLAAKFFWCCSNSLYLCSKKKAQVGMKPCQHYVSDLAYTSGSQHGRNRTLGGYFEGQGDEKTRGAITIND